MGRGGGFALSLDARGGLLPVFFPRITALRIRFRATSSIALFSTNWKFIELYVACSCVSVKEGTGPYL